MLPGFCGFSGSRWRWCGQSESWHGHGEEQGVWWYPKKRINQFQQIDLLNMEGNLVFSYCLKTDKLPETEWPGWRGVAESWDTWMLRTSLIRQQIQSAQQEGRDQQVLLLDLANAFRSVPHSLIWSALKFFHVPKNMTDLVRSSFQHLQLCKQHQSTQHHGNHWKWVQWQGAPLVLTHGSNHPGFQVSWRAS